MLLFWIACAPAPKAPITDVPPHDSAVESAPNPDSPADSRADSPPDSPADSPGDSLADSLADSPADSGPPDSPPPSVWRSAWYPEDWTPAFTAADGTFLHDFSYAGYHAGELPIPSSPPGPSFDVTTYGADPTGTTDSTAAFQATIDAAAAVAPAVVEVPGGTFRLDGTLLVSTSGVVIRGAGSASSFVYFTQATGLDYSAHIRFAGSLSEGEDRALLTDADTRDTTIYLGDAAGIAVGDEVSVGFVITPDFVAEHGMTDIWVEFVDQWKPIFRRTVVSVDLATGAVELDVPLRYPLKLRDQASLRVTSGYLTEVGITGLALSNVNTWAAAWASTQVHVVELYAVKDAFVQDVVSWESPLSTDGLGRHLLSSGIDVVDSRRVTVADTALGESQHRGDGGNGYLFEISRSNEVLTVDSVARNGRHNFIQNWDFGTSGCVWLRTTSEGSRAYFADWDPIGWPAYSEFHHSLAMANLIDQSVAFDGWQAVNRQTESSGAGHSATATVFWNLTGGGYLRSLQYGYGFVIGTDDLDLHVDSTEWDWNDAGEGTAPDDRTEGIGEAATLEPQSLYEDQLSRRLSP